MPDVKNDEEKDAKRVCDIPISIICRATDRSLTFFVPLFRLSCDRLKIELVNLTNFSGKGESAMENERTIYRCISDHAAAFPDKPAIVTLGKDGTERIISWQELRQTTDKAAAYLKTRGVQKGSRVVVAQPNGLPEVVAALASWHLGACVFFLSSQLVDGEQKVLLDQISPDLVLSYWKQDTYKNIAITDKLLRHLEPGVENLPDEISCPGKALATGGSTGIPKIIIDYSALLYTEDDFRQWSLATGFAPGKTLLICGSLHHSLFNESFFFALAMGSTVILARRFDEAQVLRAIEKYSVNDLLLVPTMMSRILRCPSCKTTSFANIESVLHAGASCPAWLKRKWIDLVGAEKVHEFYSMSERVGMTCINGTEWLDHQGSVGRPVNADLEILDDDGKPVPNGEDGNIFFLPRKPTRVGYLQPGQSAVRGPGGAVSVGDLGHLDDDGYLYILDRRSDMIVSGGKNVYAAEVENVLREYPQVKDIVVIGLTDATWGRRVHCIVQPLCPPDEFNVYDFTNFGFKRMSNTKLPKTLELVDELPRDDSGKIRRKNLVRERDIAPDPWAQFHFIKVPDGHQLYAWRAAKSRKARHKRAAAGSAKAKSPAAPAKSPAAAPGKSLKQPKQV